MLVAALVLAGLIRGLVVQSFSVPSDSMLPTLAVDSRITVWRPDALSGTIERGDVVVFDGRGSFISTNVPSPLEQMGTWVGIGPRNIYYVKRVIGVGGDRLQCCSTDGRLLRNGTELAEPYLNGATDGQPVRASAQKFDVTVPRGRVWVMGDNRDHSTDSRALLGKPGGGMIPLARITGTVLGHGASIDQAAAGDR